jgi:hypothetical protein
MVPGVAHRTGVNTQARVGKNLNESIFACMFSARQPIPGVLNLNGEIRSTGSPFEYIASLTRFAN